MKITFERTVSTDEYESDERHAVLVNGKECMSQAEWICPEDVRFCRNLMSPFDVETLLKDVIKAVQAGEEIEFEDVTVEED